MSRRYQQIYGLFFLFAPVAVAQSDLPIVGMSSKRLERIHAFIQDYIDKQ